jgi:hypothetical protein
MSSSATQPTTSKPDQTENTQQATTQNGVKQQNQTEVNTPTQSKTQEQAKNSDNKECCKKNYFRYFLYALGASTVAVGAYLLFRRFGKR